MLLRCEGFIVKILTTGLAPNSCEDKYKAEGEYYGITLTLTKSWKNCLQIPFLFLNLRIDYFIQRFVINDQIL